MKLFLISWIELNATRKHRLILVVPWKGRKVIECVCGGDSNDVFSRGGGGVPRDVVVMVLNWR